MVIFFSTFRFYLSCGNSDKIRLYSFDKNMRPVCFENVQHNLVSYKQRRKEGQKKERKSLNFVTTVLNFTNSFYHTLLVLLHLTHCCHPHHK